MCSGLLLYYVVFVDKGVLAGNNYRLYNQCIIVLSGAWFFWLKCARLLPENIPIHSSTSLSLNGYGFSEDLKHREKPLNI
ncbi:hypothetical protein DMA11_19900 [Marinilabiliaceae bacterium JC017]|nr:hypothetical protein DMA11_19900 [Marinilabiliaceae bacterium JC017]